VIVEALGEQHLSSLSLMSGLKCLLYIVLMKHMPLNANGSACKG